MRFGGNSCSKGLEGDSRPLENNRINEAQKLHGQVEDLEVDSSFALAPTWQWFLPTGHRPLSQQQPPSAARAATHPEPSRVQHLGVAGEMHVEAPVVADTHCNLLQGLVTAVGTKNLGHVRSGPAGQVQRGVTAPWAMEHGVSLQAGPSPSPGEHRVPVQGQRRSVHTRSLEAAVAAEDVAPGLADQHAVHRQHVEAHLQQHVLQRGGRKRMP